MLSQLCIRNLGLLSAVDLELGPGLQIITGGTGAGKSMLLGALDILGGVRAKTEWIRDGEDEASVAGFFVIEGDDVRRSIEEALGIELPDGELRVERRLRREGRHRTRLNGQEMPLALLQSIRTYLLDVHGQQAQFALLKPAEQLRAIDRLGGLTEVQQQFSRDYQSLRGLAAEIDSERQQRRELNDRRLYLEHVVAELDEARLEPNEREQLERELSLLEEGDQILRAVQSTLNELYDDEQSLTDRLGERLRQLTPYGEMSEGVRSFLESGASARAALDEAVAALRVVEDEVSQDPALLESKRERFDLLSRLEEKFQRPVADLCRYAVECQQELEQLVADDLSLPEREATLRDGLEDLGRRARSLSKKRRAVAAELGAELEREFEDLGLGDAVWEASFESLATNSNVDPRQSDDPMLELNHEAWLGLNATGADRLEMLFGANPGESRRPLRQVASGGELSRVMLALKRVLAAADQVGTVVFDEIDSGVGGRLGTEIGRKLAEISRSHQVFCVTHLPQVACFGEHHFHVEKRVEGAGEELGARTVTEVDRLEGERRTEELASMLRGSGRTRTSIQEAREMLSEAQSERESFGSVSAGSRSAGSGSAGSNSPGKRAAKKKSASKRVGSKKKRSSKRVGKKRASRSDEKKAKTKSS